VLFVCDMLSGGGRFLGNGLLGRRIGEKGVEPRARRLSVRCLNRGFWSELSVVPFVFMVLSHLSCLFVLLTASLLALQRMRFRVSLCLSLVHVPFGTRRVWKFRLPCPAFFTFEARDISSRPLKPSPPLTI